MNRSLPVGDMVFCWDLSDEEENCMILHVIFNFMALLSMR